MATTLNKIVLPGDRIEDAEELSKQKKVILGPGLRKLDDIVIACKAGILRMKQPNSFWIDSCQKRYVPSRGESVIGVITQKSGDTFRVDVGSSETASLSYLAFEGATKKNRPDVNIGDLVYAKILIANKDFETELVCVNSLGKKGKLGVLSGGFVFTCSINLIRLVLTKEYPLLKAIEKEINAPLEIVLGMNGKIWINGNNPRQIVAAGNAILAAEHLPPDDIRKMCDNIASILVGFC